jgi:hypothetical protein
MTNYGDMYRKHLETIKLFLSGCNSGNLADIARVWEFNCMHELLSIFEQNKCMSPIHGFQGCEFANGMLIPSDTDLPSIAGS